MIGVELVECPKCGLLWSDIFGYSHASKLCSVCWGIETQSWYCSGYGTAADSRRYVWEYARARWSSMLAVLMLCSTAFGQIDVPASVRFDKPIVATVKSGAPEGSELKLRWSASQELSLVHVGEAVHIWGPAGRHKLACSVVWLQFEVVDVAGKPVKSLVAWDMISHEREFEITGSNPLPPGPPPTPPPGPVPTPDVPSDEFGDIGRRVATWAASLPAEHRKHAPALATIYETVASMYAAGALADADAATEKTRELRDERIPDVATQTAWRAAVLNQVNEDVKSRWPLDRQQYAAYLRCISVGLKGVKQ